MRPYRDSARVGADVAPAPTADDSSLGTRCSRHVPPPLSNALIGPILIAGVLFVVLTLLVGASVSVSLIIAGASLAFLSWSPLRTYGQEVTLYAQGVVLSRKEARSVVAFDDVNEVWFEIPRLHARHGAYLRALRLVDFDGKAHRIPLTVDGGAALANAILRACSTPLLIEARMALAAGAPLTFGRIQLARAGITVKGAYAAWSDIRLGRLQPARVALFRRLPLLPWRTVALDRIPNPSIFCALVAQSVKDVRRDDHLMVELDCPGDAGTARTSARADQDLAARNIVVGGVIFLVGVAITWACYSVNHACYVIAIGPLLFGAIRFLQGLIAYHSGRSR